MSLKIERWQELWQEANSDGDWRQWKDREDKVRAQTREETLGLLRRFLASEVSVEEFRTEFDLRSHNDWAPFGLTGLHWAHRMIPLIASS